MPFLVRRRFVVPALVGLTLLFSLGLSARHQAQPPRTTLIGFARLPALTFADGPVSGQFAHGANGVEVPFESQPVQGVSSVLLLPDGRGGRECLALLDNGYGAKNTSADFLLRAYHLRPDFRTRLGGNAAVTVGSFLSLRDPDRKLGFPIVAEGATYPNSRLPVAPEIRRNRLLTGADLDPETFRQAPDGTFWFGDEFGPFLLHTSSSGKVLEAPYSVPNLLRFGENAQIQASGNPTRGKATPNLPDSGGFEGIALSADGKALYCLLEKTVLGDPEPNRLLLLSFNLASRQWGAKPLFYRKEVAAHSIGEITAVNEREFLVIERDNGEGERAAFKRVYLIDIGETDAEGYVRKTLVADLLDIADPANLSGHARRERFRFPFVTIESVAIWDRRTLLLACDNNLPGSAGRQPGKPDNTEFILISLAKPLRLTEPAGAPSR